MKWTKLIRPRTFVVMITKAQRTIREPICHGDFSSTKLCADLSSSKSSMSIAKRREFFRTAEDKVLLKRVSQKSVWPGNDCVVCNQNVSSHWFLIFLTNIGIGFNFFCFTCLQLEFSWEPLEFLPSAGKENGDFCEIFLEISMLFCFLEISERNPN